MKRSMRFAAVMMAAVMTVGTASTAMAAEWKQDSKGWWYQYSDNTYAKNEILTINGVEYAFGANGYVVNGWYLDNGAYYYSTTSGLKRGWVQSGASWYYMDPSTGRMVTGWQTIGGSKYYFVPSGEMAVGWRSIN